MNLLRSSRDWFAGITRLIPTWACVTAVLLFMLLVTGGLASYKWDWLQSPGSDLGESNSTTFRNAGLLTGVIIRITPSQRHTPSGYRSSDPSKHRPGEPQTRPLPKRRRIAPSKTRWDCSASSIFADPHCLT